MWYEEEVSYTGHGVIHINGSEEKIEGSAEVTVEPDGKLTIRIEADRPTRGPDRPFGAAGLLYGVRQMPDGARCLDVGADVLRPVGRIEVRTEDGVLTTEGDSIAAPTLEFVTGRCSLTIRPIEAVFDSTLDNARAAYWALPILNYLGSLPWYDGPSTSGAFQHPLRVSPERDFRITPSEDSAAAGAFILRSSLLVLDEADEVIFLERLPKFLDREKALRSGTVPCRQTALLVGAVRERAITYGACLEWLPFQLLPYLGLGTGLEPGAPWVEFRDHRRRLVRRIHRTFGRERFEKSWELLRQEVHGGVETILSLCCTNPVATNGRVLVALRHLLRSRADPLDLDERLTHVMQGLDGLYAYLRETRQGKVAGKVRKSKENGFGERVLTVADTLGLRDRSAIARITLDKPSLFSGVGWQKVASTKRNESFHDGFIAEGATSQEHQVVFGLYFHLSDLLTRCLLKILGYTGAYQPSVFPFHGSSWTPDWVTESTTAQDLRYLPRFPRRTKSTEAMGPEAAPSGRPKEVEDIQD